MRYGAITCVNYAQRKQFHNSQPEESIVWKVAAGAPIPFLPLGAP